MTQRACRSCKRVLQNTAFDKCMYCGEPIPADQQLSRKEKDKRRNSEFNYGSSVNQNGSTDISSVSHATDLGADIASFFDS